MAVTFPVVPSGILGNEGGLLTALVIGAVFGFALERAGFGNGRKLAAQFYLYDMTVFKVMFTAIIVAMGGLYAMQSWNLVDLGQVWINPTFLAPQIVGGFLLGVGFIISGLCPGTAFVSLVSGKLDALVVLLGVFIGTMAFALGVDGIPFMDALYHSGAGEVSTFPTLLGLSGSWLAVIIALVALAAFVGAEKVEGIMQERLENSGLHLEKTVVRDHGAKYAVVGALVLLGVIAAVTGGPVTPGAALARTPGSLAPVELADAVIRRDPSLYLVDLSGRGDALHLPNLHAIDDPAVAPAGLLPGMRVVLLAEKDTATDFLSTWPNGPSYLLLEGGVDNWIHSVLEPTPSGDWSEAGRAADQRRAELAAWFSGAETKPTVSAPPPVISSGNAGKKKKSGGC
ncbi:MAG: YeeE/YedE family protein [Candidatus Delongbacteria bacterium]|nr:YeeE/YedE family protein [Candidatus Delongbacteria bacterium]